MERNIEKKQIIIFLIAAFVPAWILQFIASRLALRGDASGRSLFGIIIACSMYIPFLAVLISRIPLKGMGWVPHLKGRIRWILFSVWVPALLALAGAVLYFLIFPGQLDTEMNVLRQSAGEEGLAMLEARGMTLETYILTTSIAALTYIPFFNIITAIGEEVGWRGALYPYLKGRFGVTKGRILGGIIWGAWHWPLMLFAGYEYGFDYIGAPVLGPVVFCCCTVFMGILHDYVYEKTGLIWIPALFHGAIDSWTIYAYILKEEYMDRMIFGPSFVGLISMIPMAALAVVLSLKQAKSGGIIKEEGGRQDDHTDQ